MFNKIILIGMVFISSVNAREGFEYRGISVKAPNGKRYVVKRHINKKCNSVIITNRMLWSENYANKEVPKECKSTYVHTTGKLLPIQLDEEVTTYGELEVLAFIKSMTKDKNLLLIDARGEEWYHYRTIPSAINIPNTYFKYPKEYEFEYEDGLKTLGVKTAKDGSFDFKGAKTVTIFCNGAWCSQSVWLIEALLKIDYPADKINWYRGGMQNWLASGMSSTRD